MNYLTYWFIFINLLSFVLFGADKAKAKKGAWRIPERTLILSAVLGGSAGAMAGMCAFRHKTRHRKFTIGLPVIFIIQVGLGALICALI